MKLLFGASLLCLAASATMLLASLGWFPSRSAHSELPGSAAQEDSQSGTSSSDANSDPVALASAPDAADSSTIFAESEFREALANLGRNAEADPEYVTVYGVECHRTRSLYAWESPVQFTKLCKSVQAGFGNRRASYLYENALIGEQILVAQGRPDLSSPAIRLGDGNFLLQGCRHPYCDEKSALIATPDGEMLAAGLIHFHCGPRSCADMAILTIFVRPEQDMPLRIEQLKAWAKYVDDRRRPVRSIEKVVLH